MTIDRIDFDLTLGGGNAALVEAPAQEVARILRDVADRVEKGHENGGCRDINGNTVGFWMIFLGEENEDD